MAADRVIAATGLPWQAAPVQVRQQITEAFAAARQRRCEARDSSGGGGPVVCIEDSPGLLCDLEQYVDCDVRLVQTGPSEAQWALMAMDGSDGDLLDVEVWLCSDDSGLGHVLGGIL
jgi:hypothetical protein